MASRVASYSIVATLCTLLFLSSIVLSAIDCAWGMAAYAVVGGVAALLLLSVPYGARRAFHRPGFATVLPTQAAQRGSLEFEIFCATCHSGELANRPALPNASPFQKVFISELNASKLPTMRFTFVNRADDPQLIILPRAEEAQECRTRLTPTLIGVEVFTTPDPGRAATTGRPGDLNLFEVPTLRGIKHTAPYFHDHSVGSLEAVIEHYNRTFGFGIIGRRQQDLLAFLENL